MSGVFRRTASVLILAVIPLGWSGSVSSADEPSAAVPENLARALRGLMPGMTIESIKPTPVSDLYEVRVAGRIFYFSGDGSYLLRGDLVDVKTRENLTERTRRKMRLAVLDRLGEETMVVFSPPSPKYTITVFTDVDCPYCARLHQEVPKLNELGVKVRYAAFPRAGLQSKSYRTMVSVWCAKDPLQAMTDAKAQRPVEPATCENSIAEHFAQGHALGVAGTPTIVLPSGELIGGYRPYRQLVNMLESG